MQFCHVAAVLCRATHTHSDPADSNANPLPASAPQVFVALLRSCQPDSKRLLIKEALDVMMPIVTGALPLQQSAQQQQHQAQVPPLPAAAAAAAAVAQQQPMWARYLKRVMTEEAHSMSHQIHIWQLILRHPDAFYSWRRCAARPESCTPPCPSHHQQRNCVPRAR